MVEGVRLMLGKKAFMIMGHRLGMVRASRVRKGLKGFGFANAPPPPGPHIVVIEFFFVSAPHPENFRAISQRS